MHTRFLMGAALCAALALPGMARAQDTFDFENMGPGVQSATQITAFPVVSAEAPSGRTVTLSQSGVATGGTGFTFEDNQNTGTSVAYGTNLNNFVIADPTDGALETLTLTFAQPVSGLTFQFATVPQNAGDLITLSATTDNALVFASGTGTFNQTSQDNEGSLTLGLAGQTFTTLNLFLSGTAAAGDTFAVDTFVVTPRVAAVPEPGAIALLAGAGLPVVVALRRRRK